MASKNLGFNTPLTRRRMLQLSALVGATAAAAPVLSACSPGGGGDPITIANVSNPVTQDLEKLTAAKYGSINPDISVRFSALPETQLRERVTKDIATGSGEFDIIAIGPYEASQYASQGWLEDLRPMMAGTPGYDPDDLVPAVTSSLSTGDQLWAVPVYSESAFLMYRKDLFEEKGLTMPDQPTWQQVADLADQIKTTDVAGIALRGLPGESQVSLMSVIYTFGGRVFTPEWQPTFTEPETREAINFYVDLVRRSGTPGASSAGFNQCLTSFTQGQAAMFMDATVAANTVEDPSQSAVAGKVGYVAAPHYRSPFGGWFWSWAYAIPKSSKNKEAAWDYLAWATSKEYITTVGDELGWASAPPGTRLSTYENAAYVDAAPYGPTTLAQIEAVNSDKILKPSAPPDLPAAYFEFPQWTDVYMPFSQEVAAAIAGQQSADQAVEKIQSTTEDTMRRIGLWNG